MSKVKVVTDNDHLITVIAEKGMSEQDVREAVQVDGVYHSLRNNIWAIEKR